MPPWLTRKFWPRADEEMAKKDDDLRVTRFSKRPPTSASWKAARMPRRRWVVRLVALALIVAFAIYLLGSALRFGIFSLTFLLHGRNSLGDPFQELLVSNVHPETTEPDAAGKRGNYNGPPTFPELATSLQSLSTSFERFNGKGDVLFIAASLSSAATLLPVACLMALEDQSNVHFAFMGRTSIPVKELLKINGIDDTCPIKMHDARPDHADSSSDARMSNAATRALHHIHRYTQPAAILVDSTAAEYAYFLQAARFHVRSMSTTLIELPERPGKRLSWITKLDASALAAWNKVHFDILIHAPATGTGNLRRLLRSISYADLGGHEVPHITLELPSAVEAPLESFLATYQWPPVAPGSKPARQMITLRRRIPQQRLTPEQSSVRFLESFWPLDPAHTHVLVLSPHTEITPQFFHYVKFALLSRRHSKNAIKQGYVNKMMGLSLSVPSTLLDGVERFTPPKPTWKDQKEAEETAFLWQAPISDAVVFMGEAWIELHGYISQVIDRQSSSSPLPAMLAKKEVGVKYPAWMEYALQLSRIRGYVTLYPSKKTAVALVGVHTDLPDIPEEHLGKAAAKRKGAKGLTDEASDMYFDAESPVDMLETLPKKDEQQVVMNLPVLSWDGSQKSMDVLGVDASQYAEEFRREVGHCSGKESQGSSVKTADKKLARDLFCDFQGKT
ncbi:hypothetical protein RJ55_06292 [Drechmeria coniospora]|nr:hypothetical protein RJ55_06292 [Drechmeria coniospora]